MRAMSITYLIVVEAMQISCIPNDHIASMISSAAGT